MFPYQHPLDRSNSRRSSLWRWKCSSLHLCVQLPCSLIRHICGICTGWQLCPPFRAGRHSSACWTEDVRNTWSELGRDGSSLPRVCTYTNPVCLLQIRKQNPNEEHL